MLQRVVRNRFELSVSLPAGSVFKGEHNGILAASEQAQTQQPPAERIAFHSERSRFYLVITRFAGGSSRKTYHNRTLSIGKKFTQMLGLQKNES
jgi:hypothetical protein